ncbi:ABC transporter permease (plasmid) [Tistrella bauzanensis]|uniref:ABC transporter permease n=1 Tax=Tistrella TaxID=171436 RepID=UPI0031F628B7
MRELASTFFRHPSGIVGAILLVAVIAMALGAPVLFPESPWEMIGAPFEPPLSEGLPFGSDTLGRDVAAGIAWGARVSLIIGIASALSAAGIGVIVGAAAGYFGGLVDDVLMRITELFQTIPGFVLAILLVSILSPSMATVIFAIAIVSWPPLARLTRAEFMSIATRDFVHAARCQGESALAIIIRHIMPNALSPIVVATSLTVATAILIESALSFLGLGDPNHMSWGFMVGSARTVIRQAWWTSVFPGIAILLTVVAVNLVGEALNDALNPRIARRGR